MSLVTDALNYICIFIDWLVYSVAELAYVLFYCMCRMNVRFVGERLESITQQLYMFLGVIMLFVVTINLLQVLVDPGTLESTTSKIAKKAGISIVLFIASGFIFNLLDQIQDVILDNQIVEKVIMGSTDQSNDEKTQIENAVGAGKAFSYSLLFAFVKNTETEKEIMKEGGDLTVPLWNVVKEINNDGVTYEYPIISTAAGILLTVMLVIYAIDIGIRQFTLMLLRVLAPIPIALYATPKGDGMLEKYIKTYISVFLEMFIKIGTCYLTLLLMSEVMRAVLGTGSTDVSKTLFPDLTGASGAFKAILVIVVIVALFQFGRRLPKLLSDILGLDLGGGSFNPFTIAGSVGGAMIGGLVGLGAGAIGGAIGGGGVVGALSSGVRGAISGGTSGSRGGAVRAAMGSIGTARSTFATQRGREQTFAEQGGWRGVIFQRANARNARNVVRHQQEIDRQNDIIQRANENINAVSSGEELMRNVETATSNYGLSTGAIASLAGTGRTYDSYDSYISGESIAERTALKNSEEAYQKRVVSVQSAEAAVHSADAAVARAKEAFAKNQTNSNNAALAAAINARDAAINNMEAAVSSRDDALHDYQTARKTLDVKVKSLKTDYDNYGRNIKNQDNARNSKDAETVKAFNKVQGHVASNSSAYGTSTVNNSSEMYSARASGASLEGSATADITSARSTINTEQSEINRINSRRTARNAKNAQKQGENLRAQHQAYDNARNFGRNGNNGGGH